MQVNNEPISPEALYDLKSDIDAALDKLEEFSTSCEVRHNGHWDRIELFIVTMDRYKDVISMLTRVQYEIEELQRQSEKFALDFDIHYRDIIESHEED